MISYKNVSQKLPQSFRRWLVKIIIIPQYLFFLLSKRSKIYLRWNSSDVNVFFHTFLEKEYVFPFKINPTFIIDAGANIGLTAIMFGFKYPNAEIVCIEPESDNFKLLKKNTNHNPHISTIKKGLWSSNSLLKIVNPDQESWAFITEETKDATNFDIEAISVDELIRTSGHNTIDILKIDIEGAEKELFLRNTANWLPQTKLIIIEIHSSEYRRICEKTILEAGFIHILVNGENDYYANLEFYIPKENRFI